MCTHPTFQSRRKVLLTVRVKDNSRYFWRTRATDFVLHASRCYSLLSIRSSSSLGTLIKKSSTKLDRGYVPRVLNHWQVHQVHYSPAPCVHRLPVSIFERAAEASRTQFRRDEGKLIKRYKCFVECRFQRIWKVSLFWNKVGVAYDLARITGLYLFL